MAYLNGNQIVLGLKYIGAGAVKWSSITANDDGTFTAVDSEGTEHELSYTADAAGKITSITLDGSTKNLTYDPDGNLIRIGSTDIDISGLPEVSDYENQLIFMSNDEKYVDIGFDGEISVNEPDEPPGTAAAPVFLWWLKNGERVSFPYEPPAGKTILSAKFSSVREEIETKTAGDLICKFSGTDLFKTNDGLAIAGYYTSEAVVYYDVHVFLIAETADAAKFNGGSTPTAFDYNGRTYYSSMATRGNGYISGGIPPHKVGAGHIGLETARKLLLDYYYNIEEDEA